MKRWIAYLLILFFASASFSGCVMEDEFSTSPKDNFDALWKILDENYCFFDYKGVDWDEIYETYSSQIDESMSQQEMFNVMVDMTYELKDGHVNLISDYRTSSYEGWHLDHPTNFNWSTIQNYFSHAGGGRAGEYDEIRYNKIADKQIGYIYYGSFKESIMERELNGIFEYFKDCRGLIIDVRENGGGSLTNSDRLASRFITEKTLCGYIQHKTGRGRNNFSTPYPIYLNPSSHADLWTKPVIVITNRRCFSAANNFVSKMREFPNVTTLGGITGGGSGFPFTSELPNGWQIRFSTSPILDVNMNHTEFGVSPDLTITLDNKDVEKGLDTLIEEAVRLLLTDSNTTKPFSQ